MVNVDKDVITGFERCGAIEKRTRVRNRGKSKRQKN